MTTTQTTTTGREIRPVLRSLLLTDLVDSTKLVEEQGDRKAAEIGARHDRFARDLLAQHGGLEIDKTDGFLFIFERPIDAVRYALAYHDALDQLSREIAVPLKARAGIHTGEVVLHENAPDDVARGAKPIEVEGLAKPVAARVMSLAQGRQTLLTRTAFDLARRASVGEASLNEKIAWLDHGPYRFKGVTEPLDVCEVGREQFAPLGPPPDSEKAKRAVAPGDESLLGWRPSAEHSVPGRADWKLERRLGEGAFGEVWLARNQRTGDGRTFKFCFSADRLVSLKRELTLFRLIKETLGERPDIARIYEVRLDAPPYYLEMDYTEGGNLREWALQQGGIDKVPLDLRLELIAQVADALSAAHSVGVIHKDVKPSNILIREWKGGRRPTNAGSESTPEPKYQIRLIDFGVGHLVNREAIDAAGIAATSFDPKTATSDTDILRHAGTHLYMAPELHAGKPSSIQSDVYALGVLLYQTVVGDLTRPIAHGWEHDITNELLREDIAACVAGELGDRLPSTDLLARRLRNLKQRTEERDGEKLKAAHDLRRRRLIRLTSAAAAITAMLSVVAAVGFFAEQKQRRNAELESRLREKINDFNQEMLSSADTEQGNPRDRKVRDVLLSAAARIDSDSSLEPLVEAGIRNTIGAAFRSQASYDEAKPQLEKALEIRRAQLPSDHPDVATSLFNLGAWYHVNGDSKQAHKLYREALDIRRKVLPPEHPALAYSLTFLGALLADQGDIEGAEKLYREALAIRRAALGSDHIDTAASVNNLATILMYQDKNKEAEPLFREALAAARRIRGRDDTYVARGMSNLGACLMEQGRHGEGYEQLEAGLAIKRKEQGVDHPDVAKTLQRLAGYKLAQHDLPKAREYCSEALEIRRKKLPANHPDLAYSLNALGTIALDEDKTAEAEPLLRESLKIRRDTNPETSSPVIETLCRLAACLTKQTKFTEAEKLLVDGYRPFVAQTGPPSEEAALARMQLEALYIAWGKPDQALKYHTDKATAGATNRH
jgi:serine/threonine-protein kinase